MTIWKWPCNPYCALYTLFIIDHTIFFFFSESKWICSFRYRLNRNIPKILIEKQFEVFWKPTSNEHRKFSLLIKFFVKLSKIFTIQRLIIGEVTVFPIWILS